MDNNELINYFKGDSLAASVWKDKYQLKDDNGVPEEATPEDMHRRLAQEIYRIDHAFVLNDDTGLYDQTSSYFRRRVPLTEERIFELLDKFKYLIPGGSTMQLLGNPYQIGSLSNCFVIGQPEDSYSGIFKLREEQAQLMKRRGGVGKDLSSLRPKGAKVKNAAKTSTGAPSFMHVDSEITREVAQDGRRGALMLTIDIRHPDSLEFITSKQNLDKVTGANISVMLRDDFMEAVKNDTDYYLRWPVNMEKIMVSVNSEEIELTFAYNSLFDEIPYDKLTSIGNNKYIKRIKAKEYWDTLCRCAWNTAEPGIMFLDNHYDWSPDTVYPEHKGITTNPCGEIFMSAYDACRLIAANVYSFVDNPFTEGATFNRERAYSVFYEQCRIADNIIDLEFEAVKYILSVCTPNSVEYNLWYKIMQKMHLGRRTGCGITGLGDMLAALGTQYGKDASLTVNLLMNIKMRAELDCQTDLAMLRGPFASFDPLKIVNRDNEATTPFYDFIEMSYPEQFNKMLVYGHRNVSWSTVAPTGSISILTQTTSGIEPLTFLSYIRRVKMVQGEGTPDYVDPNNGDWFKEFLVVHPKVYEWYSLQDYDRHFDDWPMERRLEILESSPWYNSTADKVNSKERIDLQAIVQRYTTHSISSTINLPKEATVEDISQIFMYAHEQSLKGVTVYRDGSRAGIIVNKTDEEFQVHHAPRRGKALPAILHQVTVKGEKYAVIVGLKNKHVFEVFAIRDTDISTSMKVLRGTIFKVKKGSYSFFSADKKYRYDNIQQAENMEESATTLYVSMLLRHGSPIEQVIKTMKKVNNNITSFTSAITRVLSKYVPNGVVSSETCSNCGSKLTFENGCFICKNCGSTPC